MAEKNEAPTAAASGRTSSVAVRLGESAAGQPLLANYSSATVTSGMVLVDFGFLEPGMLNALSRAARSGGKIPAAVNGRLAARVALPPDVARSLYAQLGRLLAASPKGKGEKGPSMN